jgi:hypothetical protein
VTPVTLSSKKELLTKKQMAPRISARTKLVGKNEVFKKKFCKNLGGLHSGSVSACVYMGREIECRQGIGW